MVVKVAAVAVARPRVALVRTAAAVNLSYQLADTAQKTALKVSGRFLFAIIFFTPYIRLDFWAIL